MFTLTRESTLPPDELWSRVAALADRLEELPALDHAAARRRLVSIPGVGVWTAAETAHRALGDQD